MLKLTRTEQSNYQVELPQFNGPLELLLTLVGQAKLDITAISLARVADQYRSYLETLQGLNVEIESSYLVVFAQLLEIKSKLLLPPTDEPEEESDAVDRDEAMKDPAQELVEKLKEYASFKEAADWLAEREGASAARYPRNAALPELDWPELEVSADSLADAMRRLDLAPRAPRAPVSVEKISFSLPERIGQILTRLFERPRWFFKELLEGRRGKAWIVVTFLAVLEMARRQQVHLEQEADEIEVSVRQAA